MLAMIIKNSHGVPDLDAHAINISGGTNPNTVSESRKNEKIIWGEYVSTRVFSNELKSRKKISNASKIAATTTIAIPPFMAVSFKKE